MSEDQGSSEEKRSSGENEPSVEKEGIFRCFGDEMKFKYRVQGSEGKSLMLRKELRILPENKGLIGVLLSNRKVAWSREAPRHIALATAEGERAMARFQTTRSLVNAFPEIQIHAYDIESGKKLAAYLRRSAPNLKSLLFINVTNSIAAEDGPVEKIERVYSGNLSDFSS